MIHAGTTMRSYMTCARQWTRRLCSAVHGAVRALARLQHVDVAKGRAKVALKCCAQRHEIGVHEWQQG